ncbi:hypothetical protein VaNZ11_001842, partial [Volvox africanus]
PRKRIIIIIIIAGLIPTNCNCNWNQQYMVSRTSTAKRCALPTPAPAPPPLVEPPPKRMLLPELPREARSRRVAGSLSWNSRSCCALNSRPARPPDRPPEEPRPHITTRSHDVEVSQMHEINTLYSFIFTLYCIVVAEPEGGERIPYESWPSSSTLQGGLGGEEVAEDSLPVLLLGPGWVPVLGLRLELLGRGGRGKLAESRGSPAGGESSSSKGLRQTGQVTFFCSSHL